MYLVLFEYHSGHSMYWVLTKPIGGNMLNHMEPNIGTAEEIKRDDKDDEECWQKWRTGTGIPS